MKKIKNAHSFEWLGKNGDKITCYEKNKIIDDNLQDIRSALIDGVEDAVLMGLDEAYFKKNLMIYIENVLYNKDS